MKSIVYFVVQIHIHELIVVRGLSQHCRPESTKQNRREMHCRRGEVRYAAALGEEARLFSKPNLSPGEIEGGWRESP